jgi:protein-tyrosine phosphatase
MVERIRQPLKPPESLDMFFRVDDYVFRSSLPKNTDEFRFIKAVGVDTIISFEPLGDHTKMEAQSHGLDVIDYPIADGTLPNREKVEGFLDLIGKQIAQGKKVLIHCMAGRDRTGLMTGFYLIRYHNMEPLQAYWEADKKFLEQESKEYLLKCGHEIKKANKP